MQKYPQNHFFNSRSGCESYSGGAVGFSIVAHLWKALMRALGVQINEPRSPSFAAWSIALQAPCLGKEKGCLIPCLTLGWWNRLYSPRDQQGVWKSVAVVALSGHLYLWSGVLYFMKSYMGNNKMVKTCNLNLSFKNKWSLWELDEHLFRFSFSFRGWLEFPFLLLFLPLASTCFQGMLFVF